MKRRVLSWGLVVVFLLLFCTLLAPKIEDEMRLLVELEEIDGSDYVKRNPNVPISALLWEDGARQLYCVQEGYGWESGLRVAQIPQQYYTDMGGHVSLGPGTDYSLIVSAAHRPVDGALVEQVEAFQTGEDVYLLYCPDGIEKPEKLPRVLEPVSSTETVILANMKKAKFPFFEMKIRNSLTKIGAEGVRVFSMTEAQTFLEALPWMAGIGVALIAGFLLCMANCFLSIRKERAKWPLWVNWTLAGLCLCGIPALTEQFQLPAPLMPKESILDIGHYRSEFGMIFEALQTIGSHDLHRLFQGIYAQCIRIIAIGVAVTLVLIVLEWIITSKRVRINRG